MKDSQPPLKHSPPPKMPPELPDAEKLRILSEQYAEIAAMAGGLAHEIKNPLSTIRLNMELLAEDLKESQDPRSRRALSKVSIMQRECQRLQDLLENFLNFAKIRRTDMKPCDLNEEVQAALHFFRPQAEDAGIEIWWYPDPDLPSVLLDPEAFRGALLNLILNAQQAMTKGGQLMVRTRPTPRGVALDIIDNGPGIDRETLEKIFTPFYSTKRGGTGLGLPTARKIIEAHGGAIAVQSEVGRGTHFTLELPVLQRLTPADETIIES